MTDPGVISSSIDEAGRRLIAGGLVAVPTETVYGLAANAEDGAAVKRIFEVKGRPHDHPLIVHLADGSLIDDGWVGQVSTELRALAATCWPGPLTVLVPRGERVIDEVTGKRPSVGLRVPSHPLTRTLLTTYRIAVAAPSANRFGKVSPTTAAHVYDDLGAVLDPEQDLILDGGPAEIGVESTIVDLTTPTPQILRAGAITADDIAEIIQRSVDNGSGPSRAAGMLTSHYTPDCDIWLAPDRSTAEGWAELARNRGWSIDVLDRTDDLVDAAHRLYADLRAADARDLDILVVVTPPPSGLGIALGDRLAKAAAIVSLRPPA